MTSARETFPLNNTSKYLLQKKEVLDFRSLTFLDVKNSIPLDIWKQNDIKSLIVKEGCELPEESDRDLWYSDGLLSLKNCLRLP